MKREESYHVEGNTGVVETTFCNKCGLLIYEPTYVAFEIKHPQESRYISQQHSFEFCNTCYDWLIYSLKLKINKKDNSEI